MGAPFVLFVRPDDELAFTFCVTFGGNLEDGWFSAKFWLFPLFPPPDLPFDPRPGTSDFEGAEPARKKIISSFSSLINNFRMHTN